MNSKYLKSFDFATFLKRRFMVGQLDPWRIDDDGEPFYALLVSLETAIAECQEWSGQDLGRKEFMNYLKLNNIHTLRNIDEIVQVREERKERQKAEKEEKKKHKRVISEERKQALREQLSKIRPSVTKNP